MTVVCSTCGTRHKDPDVQDLTGWRCARCGNATLMRMRLSHPGRHYFMATVALVGLVCLLISCREINVESTILGTAFLTFAMIDELRKARADA